MVCNHFKDKEGKEKKCHTPDIGYLDFTAMIFVLSRRYHIFFLILDRFAQKIQWKNKLTYKCNFSDKNKTFVTVLTFLELLIRAKISSIYMVGITLIY